MINRRDLLFLLILLPLCFALYYPVTIADYLYTDEANQLWFFRDGINFHTSVAQGRFLTYKIFSWVFSSIQTIEEVSYARIFSLSGWIACLPVWYYVFSRISLKNGISPAFAMLTCVYLISIPSFTISIVWASCLQLFIACTAGLISGYFAYVALYGKGANKLFGIVAVLLSVLFAMVSLFSYQNGFGCFVLPFLMQLVFSRKISRELITGVALYIGMYILYYGLYKYGLWYFELVPDQRSSFVSNPVKKLFFFFARPLSAGFQGTVLFNERSITGSFFAIVVASAWLILLFIRAGTGSWKKTMVHLSAILVLLLLTYLPSLLVKENYASGRTLLALKMGVFILLADILFWAIYRRKHYHVIAGQQGRMVNRYSDMHKKHGGMIQQYVGLALLSVLFIVNAWHNLNRQFIEPVSKEFYLIRSEVADDFRTETTTVHVILPGEDAFVKRFGNTRYWDEFGVPSTAKSWTSESLIKQLIYEKTGSRETAEKLVIKTWLNKGALEMAGFHVSQMSAREMLINVPELLNK